MIEIKNACPEDILGMQDVYYKTWLVTYPNKEAGITTEDIEEFYKDSFTKERLDKRALDILNLPTNSIYLVAKDGNNVVGVCKGSIEESFNEFHAIYILPEYQRKGIGKMFWSKIQEFFDANKDIVVDLAEYNIEALSFYKSLGFIDTKKRFTHERYKMPVSGNLIPLMEMVFKR